MRNPTTAVMRANVYAMMAKAVTAARQLVVIVGDASHPRFFGRTEAIPRTRERGRCSRGEGKEKAARQYFQAAENELATLKPEHARY